jgi:protein-L-isoaspartate(D-aspartate) O-methyltransferase
MLIGAVGFARPAPAASADDERARRAMVDTIALLARADRGAALERTLDPRVLEAMARVPRHEFVPERQRAHAYENRPLPIGYGQTISQPYIVALMTDLLRVDPDSTVLEVGTGSGYQAAVLAELARRVHTIEIIEELGDQAARRLQRLGYRNVEAAIGDGYYGWQERAPFDAIVVTAAASHIPPHLVRQLKPGGRMVIPVGQRFLVQQLTLVEKDSEGQVATRQLLPVSFVPLTGGH